MSACSTPTDCARPQTSQRPAFRRTPWTLSPASPRCCCPTAAESPSHHCTSARVHNHRAAHGRVCRSPRRTWGRDACQGRTTTPRRHTDARRRRRSRMRAPANHARETPRPDLCPSRAILCTAIERSDGADRQPQVTALTHVGSGGAGRRQARTARAAVSRPAPRPSLHLPHGRRILGPRARRASRCRREALRWESWMCCTSRRRCPPATTCSAVRPPPQLPVRAS